MSVYKTKDGLFMADIVFKDGSRLRKRFVKKADAVLFIQNHQDHSDKKPKNQSGSPAVQSSIASRALNASGRVTFDKAFNAYMQTKLSLRPKSIQKYLFIISQLRQFVSLNGLVYLDQFTPDHADSIYSQLSEEKVDSRYKNGRIIKIKPKTINFFLGVLKSFFNGEVEKNHMQRNPAMHLKCAKYEKKRHEFYTIEELKAFFLQPMDEAYRNAFTALLHTGVRFAELANLTWEDIDLKRKLIYIRPKDDFHTKTYLSERSLSLDNTMFELLVKLSLNKKSDIFPFPSIEGFQLRERKLLAKCKDISIKAGIKSRSFLHKFRHTYASHLIQNKVPLEAIQKLLGHSSIKETLIYAYVKSDELHSEVSILDSLFSFNDNDKSSNKKLGK